MARLQRLKLPKGVEIDEVSNDNFFTHPSARSVPTTLAVKDYLHDEIDKHDQEFMPDGLYRNAIINGNFDVWQRGTSFTGPNGRYTVDLFKAMTYSDTLFTLSRSTDAPPGSRYSCRIKSTSESIVADSFTDLKHHIEDFEPFRGKYATFSLQVKADQEYIDDGGFLKLYFQYSGDGYSPSVTVYPTTGWARYSATFKLPSYITSLIVFPRIYRYGVRAGAGVNIAQAQLNIGDKPLPFAPRPIAEELALCQRYYRTWTQQTENGRIHIPLWPPMRVAPTMTASAGTISNITAAGFNLTHNAQAATTISASSEL